MPEVASIPQSKNVDMLQVAQLIDQSAQQLASQGELPSVLLDYTWREGTEQMSAQLLELATGASVINCWSDQCKKFSQQHLTTELGFNNSPLLQIADNSLGNNELRSSHQQ
jgi:hypothetical protein